MPGHAQSTSESAADDPEALQERWVRIDLGALAGNVRALKAMLGADGPRLMAVVKADGYGHGAAGIAPALRAAGADWFGVTTIGEALELVRAGIDSHANPILLFSPPTQPEQVRAAVAFGLHLTVCDQTHLDLVASAAPGANPNLHLKVDTGMGRLGLGPDSAIRIAAQRRSWAGIYTHFANASEPGLTATMRQLHTFKVVCSRCRGEGIDIGVRHCANSAAALRAPDTRLDMVRIGTALYGQLPPNSRDSAPVGLCPDTFQARARVSFVRQVGAGTPIGYGTETVTGSARSVAVLPIGFADGFEMTPASLYRGWRGVRQIVLGSRSGASGPFVTIAGRRARVLGRVAMQMIVVDVTGFEPAVRCGDIADIPMRRLSASPLLPRRYEGQQ